MDESAEAEQPPGRWAAAGRRSGRDRLDRIWASRWSIVQAGSAAGLAWFIAQHLIGHQMPFFAPISAVIVLGGSAGQRLRRTIELVVGVAVGIVVGDLLIVVLGSGALQLAIVVSLALAAALFLGGGVMIANQAAASAVLIATLYPPSGGFYFSRWIDALIGGGVAFAVHALLLPADPLAAVRRAARPVLTTLADAFTATAAALRTADLLAAEATLVTLRATEPALQGLTDTLANATETVAVTPARWRDKDQVSAYLGAASHLDHAVRNARVLARRARVALRATEPIPGTLPAALDDLADAVRRLDHDLEHGRDPRDTRDLAVRAANGATEAFESVGGISVIVMTAQVRSVAFDLLLATGLDEAAAHERLDPVEP